MMPFTIDEKPFERTVATVEERVVEAGMTVFAISDSVEQMNLVQGDLGMFSIIGQRIGVSGVWQPFRLYIGQFFRDE